MYTLKKISQDLIKSDEDPLDSYFVAAAVEINAAGQSRHVGLIIHCEEGYYLFHFDGQNIEIEEEPVGWYFHKTLDFILPEFCNQFLGHCKKIKEKAKPKFGLFYPGSYYNENGEYYSESGLEEYMSCVGFCINVIKGFIEADEYFRYEDWTNVDFKKKYIEEFIIEYKKIKPDITEDLIADNIRRITPPEYLASAYLDDLPIRRVEVRQLINNVVQAIKDKRVA